MSHICLIFNHQMRRKNHHLLEEENHQHIDEAIQWLAKEQQEQESEEDEEEEINIIEDSDDELELLYGSETWNVTSQQLSALNGIHNNVTRHLSNHQIRRAHPDIVKAQKTAGI
jgi:hypothetical protein